MLADGYGNARESPPRRAGGSIWNGRAAARSETVLEQLLAQLHTAVARASHNNILAESVQQLVGHVRVYRERLMEEIQGMPSGDIAEHRAVVEAIKNRDSEVARAAMVMHIRRFAELVRAFDGQPGRVRHSGGSPERRRG
jgi:DNA-binding GntR family transcriptional regulator